MSHWSIVVFFLYKLVKKKKEVKKNGEVEQCSPFHYFLSFFSYRVSSIFLASLSFFFRVWERIWIDILIMWHKNYKYNNGYYYYIISNAFKYEFISLNHQSKSTFFLYLFHNCHSNPMLHKATTFFPQRWTLLRLNIKVLLSLWFCSQIIIILNFSSSGRAYLKENEPY